MPSFTICADFIPLPEGIPDMQLIIFMYLRVYNISAQREALHSSNWPEDGLYRLYIEYLLLESVMSLAAD